MGEKWTSETTMKFLREIKLYQCLWNAKYPTYKMKHMREKAWRKVVDAMAIRNFDVPEAKKKMRNLRSTYCQEKGKVSKSKAANGGYEYVPSIKWFNVMDSMLNDEDKEMRKTINNVSRNLLF